MAQLVKLSDYISRYEVDIYRYSSRFVRLKRERWERLLQDWQQRHETVQRFEFFSQQLNEGNHLKLHERVKKLLPFRKEYQNNSSSSLHDQWQYESNRMSAIKNQYELKKQFKEEIFHFQLNWASSTISEISDLKRRYYYDSLLSFLAKELPDSYFVFYEAVIQVKKAPVDMDIIVLTPSEIWLIKPLLGSETTIYQSHSDRFWLKENNSNREKLLHPGISIKRMRSVMETILVERGLSSQIRTVILAKDSFIDIPPTQLRIKLIDKRNFSKWRDQLIRNSIPIKHNQLKIAEVLLEHCVTISQYREDQSDLSERKFEIEDD